MVHTLKKKMPRRPTLYAETRNTHVVGRWRHHHWHTRVWRDDEADLVTMEKAVLEPEPTVAQVVNGPLNYLCRVEAVTEIDEGEGDR